jgi:hypothetical protein
MYFSTGARMHVQGFGMQAFPIGTSCYPLGPNDTPKKLWDQVKPILGTDYKVFPAYEHFK